MKKGFSLLICMILLLSCAAAEQTVFLPQSRYALILPDGMAYSAPEEEDFGVKAFISDTLEMDYRSYPREEAAAFGLMPTMRESAETLAAQGADVELRDVNGIEMLVYRVTDDADGAPCIGYVFEDGDQIVEVFFWYATQDAADMTKKIMETIAPIRDP